MDIIDRYRGCLIGLAVGDALGTTSEFRAPGTFSPISDIVGGGPFGLKPGEWTDDTSMALCLAESLISKSGFDPVDQLERYLLWYRHGHLSSTGGCFDIGNTVRKALLKFESTREPYCGSTDPTNAGNGSIMRLCPVPMFLVRNPKEAVSKAGDSSRTTHGARTTVDACRYLGGLLVGALKGLTKEEIMSNHFTPVQGLWDEEPLHPKISEIAGGSFKWRTPPDIKGTGFVVDSLEAALWAFYNSKDFREGALLAVNLGNDADTTGAVYGQLAGAFYGESGIPKEWKDKIVKRDLIESYADKLFNLCEEEKSC